MNFLHNTLNTTNDQLKRQVPLVQIFAGLAAGTVCGCVLLHLGKSILYALGLSLLFFELTSSNESTARADDQDQWEWNSTGGLFKVDMRPYVREMKELFITSQSLAVSFVAGCLIGVSIGDK